MNIAYIIFSKAFDSLSEFVDKSKCDSDDPVL